MQPDDLMYGDSSGQNVEFPTTRPRVSADIIGRMLGRTCVLLALSLLGSQAGVQDSRETDTFAPLRFLVGTWAGDQAGQPGKGTARRTYQFILNGRFLQETNTSTYLPQEKNKAGEVHRHMSMISYDTTRKLFVFRQFHTEGFVNTYVQEPGGNEKVIAFVSEAIENIPPGWRARETYTMLSNDEFTERFEIAEPGRGFELYSEAHLKRVR